MNAIVFSMKMERGEEFMKLIFDVGAHKGEDTEFYLKKGFNVVAVEANATLAQELRQRFHDSILSGCLVVVEAAVAEHDGQVEFFVNEQSVYGTINPSWADRNNKNAFPSTKVCVAAVRFQKLLMEYGVPYYLKIDIEGADMLCVRALEDVSSLPAFVSVESNKTSWRELVSEFDVLERLGYKRFQVINQARIKTQKEPTPAQEGAFVNHCFQGGSSGLFGADLPGPWLTKRQALLKYAIIFMHYKLLGDNTLGSRIARQLPLRLYRILKPGWYDTHAALGELQPLAMSASKPDSDHE